MKAKTTLLTIGGVLLGVLAILGAALALLWLIAEGMSRESVTLWAIGATGAALVFLLAWLPVLLLGWYAGRYELRGFFSGFDAALDRLGQAVDLRGDNLARAAGKMGKAAQPAPPAMPDLAALLPPLEHEPPNGDVIELR